MNAVDLIALLNQTIGTGLALTQILQAMNAEGRTTLTDEERAVVRKLATDSDERLSQAIARG